MQLTIIKSSGAPFRHVDKLPTVGLVISTASIIDEAQQHQPDILPSTTVKFLLKVGPEMIKDWKEEAQGRSRHGPFQSRLKFSSCPYFDASHGDIYFVPFPADDLPIAENIRQTAEVVTALKAVFDDKIPIWDDTIKYRLLVRFHVLTSNQERLFEIATDTYRDAARRAHNKVKPTPTSLRAMVPLLASAGSPAAGALPEDESSSSSSSEDDQRAPEGVVKLDEIYAVKV